MEKKRRGTKGDIEERAVDSPGWVVTWATCNLDLLMYRETVEIKRGCGPGGLPGTAKV